MADWWQQSGTTSSELTGSPVIAGTTGAWGIASCSITGDMLQDRTITQDKIGWSQVYSEKASTRLCTRSVSVALPGDPTKGNTWGSTDIALWKAPTPVSLLKVTVIPQIAWQFVTCGEELCLFSCVAGILGTYCTSSTEFFKTLPADYVFSEAGNQDIAACEYLRIGIVGLGTCSDIGYGLVQIDYWTTG